MSGLRRTVFRPLDPDFVEDPYPTYDRLRREHPIGWATTPAQGCASTSTPIARNANSR